MTDYDDYWPARNPTARNRRRRRIPLIEIQASVYWDVSADEEDNDGLDLAGFIVDDYVY